MECPSLLHFTAPFNDMPLFPITSSQVHIPRIDCPAVCHLARTCLFMQRLLLLPLPTSVLYSPGQVEYGDLDVQFLPMIDVIIQEVLSWCKSEGSVCYSGRFGT